MISLKVELPTELNKSIVTIYFLLVDELLLNLRSYQFQSLYYLQQHLNENPCMIKVVITEKETCKDSKCLIRETVVTKEEVLHCKDGYDGPSYWQLFAQFYYNQNGLTTPAYCRQYARPDHPFKTPGMICLNQKGIWKTNN